MALFNGKNTHFSFLFLLILLAAAVCLSCTDFFSNSWATWAARDPDKLIPKVTAGNIDELIAMAENNPKLSLAILKKIQSAVNGASGSEKLKLQSAALETAVNAVGLGQSVLSAAGELTNVKGPDDALDLVLDAINSMKNLDAASSALLDILPEPDLTPESDFRKFADATSADDLAMAAVLLIAGEAKNQAGDSKDDLVDYVENLGVRLSSDPPDVDPEGSENLAQIMAIASALSGRTDELNSSLFDVLSGLNLLTNLSNYTP